MGHVYVFIFAVLAICSYGLSDAATTTVNYDAMTATVPTENDASTLKNTTEAAYTTKKSRTTTTVASDVPSTTTSNKPSSKKARHRTTTTTTTINYDSMTATVPTENDAPNKPYSKKAHHRTTTVSTATRLPIIRTTPTPAAGLSDSSSAVTPSHSSFSCANREPGMYPTSENACDNYFYICEPEADYAIEFDCASHDTYFDATSGFCLEKAYVSACGGVATTTQRPVFVSTEIPFAFDCEQMDDGDYARESECSQLYVSCSGGMAVYRTCPIDTYFDADSSECLEKDWVKVCGGESTTRMPATTVAADTTFDCSSHDDGFYASADCASIFYACSGGVARGMKCAESTVFDSSTGVCLERAFVDECPGGKATTIAPFVPAVTGPAPFAFDCSGKADGEYANPKQQCSSLFVSCSGGLQQPIYRQCPADTKFDELSGECLMDSFILACGGEATTSLPETTVAADTSFDCTDKADGFYPSDACSSSFYSCSGGDARAMTCPGHANRVLKFDVDSEMCLLERYVSACGGKATTTTTSIPDTANMLPHMSCAGKTAGVYEDPTMTPTAGGVCSSLYIVCLPDAVDAIVNECPKGTMYDVTVDQCLYAYNVTACGGKKEKMHFRKTELADQGESATEAAYTARPSRTTRHMMSTTEMDATESSYTKKPTRHHNRRNKTTTTTATSEPATEASYTTKKNRRTTTIASDVPSTTEALPTTTTSVMPPATEASYTTAKQTRRPHHKKTTTTTAATSELPPATEASYTTKKNRRTTTIASDVPSTTEATTTTTSVMPPATEAAYTTKKSRPTRITSTAANDIPSTPITAGY